MGAGFPNDTILKIVSWTQKEMIFSGSWESGDLPKYPRYFTNAGMDTENAFTVTVPFDKDYKASGLSKPLYKLYNKGVNVNATFIEPLRNISPTLCDFTWTCIPNKDLTLEQRVECGSPSDRVIFDMPRLGGFSKILGISVCMATINMAD
jgi:hypothetical protein